MDDRLTKRVGAVTLILVVAAIAFAIFIAPGLRHRGAKHIRVFFHHGGGLREGAPLVVAGREVGLVQSIATAEGGVEATVAIEQYAELISRGGDVFVASRGPLGDKYLELGAAPEAGHPYAENERVVGRDPPQMDRVLNRTWDNLQTAKAFVDELRPAWKALVAQLEELRANLRLAIPPDLRDGKLSEQVDALVAEALQLRDGALGGDVGMAKLGAVLDKTRLMIAESRTRVADLQGHARVLIASVDALRGRIDTKGVATLVAIDRAIERAKAAIDKIDPLLASVAALNDRIARGEGTLGRLARDPEFPEDAKELGKILKRQPWKIIARPPK